MHPFNVQYWFSNSELFSPVRFGIGSTSKNLSVLPGSVLVLRPRTSQSIKIRYQFSDLNLLLSVSQFEPYNFSGPFQEHYNSFPNSTAKDMNQNSRVQKITQTLCTDTVLKYKQKNPVSLLLCYCGWALVNSLLRLFSFSSHTNGQKAHLLFHSKVEPFSSF